MLTPLAVADAVGMADVLSDPRMYEFIGGEPETAQDLRQRYERQVLGHSGDGSQLWFNWIVRRTADFAPMGYVQATVEVVTTSAEVAWVIAPDYQGHGFATEATRAMLTWLEVQGCAEFLAHVNPSHEASGRVAKHLGFHATDQLVDGEVRWNRRG